MYCCADVCVEIVEEQRHLCNLCLRKKWGAEPCCFLTMFPPVLGELMLGFLADDYALWITHACKSGDLDMLRSLLNRSCSKKDLCATLKQQCILEHSFSNLDDTSIACYLIDRFVSSDKCEQQHNLSDTDPFVLALCENNLELANQLQHQVRNESDCLLLFHTLVYDKRNDIISTEWLQCAIPNVPTFIEMVQKHRWRQEALCDTIARLNNQYLFELFGDINTDKTIILTSLIRYDNMQWFDEVWCKTFYRGHVFDERNAIMVQMVKFAIVHQSFSILNFVIGLSKFKIPQSLERLCSEKCKKHVAFVEWIERSTKNIFNFLLRSLTYELANPLCSRIFYHLLDKRPNNQKRLSFFESTKANNSTFCILASQNQWDIFFDIIARYKLQSIGPSGDCCIIVNACIKHQDRQLLVRLLETRLLLPCKHKPLCKWFTATANTSLWTK